ncbi:MAG TPA: hypothetical protein VGN52_11300 [Burkholderiales bacterium]|jgi:hypothetical protein
MSIDRPPISGDFQNAVEHNPPQSSKSRKSQPPFSLRLSAEEKAELVRKAGKKPLGAYIRTCLLGGAETPRRARRQPAKDDKALAKLLGELGKAKLANNLNQLARAAHLGALPVTPDTEKALADACQEVRWMRDTLIAALGLQAGP